jgi:hypothetical protein
LSWREVGRGRAIWRTAVRLIPLLFLAGCVTSASASPPSHQRASAPNRAPTARQLARLVAEPSPYRNLYLLADQLKLRPPRPIPHVIGHRNPNYPIGHQERFWVLSEDQNKYFQMPATIRAKTPHFYIYVQNGLKVSDTALQAAANRFEKHTYPTDRKYFGSEWTPGISGDPHITCLYGDLRSAQPAGYFSGEDEYPRLVNPWSNQRNLFYINSANTLVGGGTFDFTLAHEFQHMIHWHMHPHDSLWLNEGMSELAEQLNGFSVGEQEDFISQPKTQLDAWDPNNDFPHYGAAYLFLSYLNERFGARFTREMLADSKHTDFSLIDDVLRRLHIRTTGRTLFAQWVVANYLDDKSIGSGVYGYKNLKERISISNRQSVPFGYHGSVPPYAADYTVLDSLQNEKPFTLKFSAPTTIPLLSLAGGPQEYTPFWWSNRGDMMQTGLERTVDLRHVKHASLHFQAAWDLEQDYDYVYVEASADGGKTYATVPGTDTTYLNPNGASYGNAYTGWKHPWSDQTIDLSHYAGHRIKLRFQYVTDDGVNGEGFLMRNLSIPEIKWHDNFTGWNAKGFLPVYSNLLPSDWMVQLISFTAKRTTVSTLPLSATKQASIVINPGKQGLKKLVVVVFTITPKSTVNTSYQLTAAQ